MLRYQFINKLYQLKKNYCWKACLFPFSTMPHLEGIRICGMTSTPTKRARSRGKCVQAGWVSSLGGRWIKRQCVESTEVCLDIVQNRHSHTSWRVKHSQQVLWNSRAFCPPPLSLFQSYLWPLQQVRGAADLAQFNFKRRFITSNFLSLNVIKNLRAAKIIAYFLNDRGKEFLWLHVCRKLKRAATVKWRPKVIFF